MLKHVALALLVVASCSTHAVATDNEPCGVGTHVPAIEDLERKLEEVLGLEPKAWCGLATRAARYDNASVQCLCNAMPWP